MLINLSCQAVAMKARRVSTDPFPKLSLNFLRSDLNLILSWVQVARNSYKCTAQLVNNKKTSCKALLHLLPGCSSCHHFS